MNIFKKAIKDKQDILEKLRSSRILVSNEITKLIDVNPSCGEPVQFDQVDGYLFNNRNQLRLWSVYKISHLGHPSRDEEYKSSEIDYTDKDEVSKFFNALNEVLQSDESKYA